MDESNVPQNKPTNPRRRKRSQMQIIKEDYLPVVISGLAIILVVIFIIGSITRGIQGIQYRKRAEAEAALAAQQAQEKLEAEAASILEEAKALAVHFDYDGAMDLILSFSGELSEFPELQEKYNEYEQASQELVLWDDPNKVLSLSLQVLIADPQRAFTNADLGISYNRNFLTVGEFQKILQQLYANNYILIRTTDLYANGALQPLYLPEGKKPLLLTQTNVNYYTYMVDSDGDKLPDKDGAGFASRLAVDANGFITCEIVNADGTTTTGPYDLVPILESFIETHPDFSYKGARAILAVSGYDGIFGYRTSPAAKEHFGEAQHAQEVSNAKQIVSMLRELGYELACYTYENEPYGNYTAGQISQEMVKWDDEVTPILGTTELFVFSRNSDIGPAGGAYNDERFDLIYSYGYTTYLGFSTTNEGWHYANDDYFRMSRIILSGSSLAHHSLWFEGILDPATILDPSRGDIPG